MGSIYDFTALDIGCVRILLRTCRSGSWKMTL